MINILISTIVGALIYLGSGYFVEYQLTTWTGLLAFLPSMVGFGVTYWLIARWIGQQIQAIVSQVQVELQRAQQSAGRLSKKQRDLIWDRAISLLEDARKYRWWQLFIGRQIDGQIGTLLYANKKFDEAESYLERALPTDWVAKTMLGAHHYRRKDEEKMDKAFEKAVKGAGKDDSLPWAVYAWCKWRRNDRDGAIEILNRAKDKVDDDRIDSNLDALRNGRRMKMRSYDDLWYQFHLATPPVHRMKQAQRGHVAPRHLYS